MTQADLEAMRKEALQALKPIAALWERFDNTADMDAGLLAWICRHIDERELVNAFVRASKAYDALVMEDGHGEQ